MPGPGCKEYYCCPKNVWWIS